ncbi:MAG: flagellar basal body P-ring protein FlgI [Firmicutes bacterium]|jgi:flagellar P-ring protein precursor FlgI|nr:flagellar basal body P-ring protein FlgI [Bacillota bacterium]
MAEVKPLPKKLISAALLILALSGIVWASDGPQVGIIPVEPLVRVKDIARVQGVRDNQLVGLGLVVGLAGTGDGRGTLANVQMVANMLANFGVPVDARSLRTRNVAAVMLTADLPAYVRPGDRIDVTVSSLGDAKSLEGGYLLQTPLEAANGQIYAVAQGPVSVGGFSAGAGGASVQKNHPTVGIVPNGAIVEAEVPTSFLAGDEITLLLHRPDFTTAARLAKAVDEAFGQPVAEAVDRAAVRVKVPPAYEDDVVGFVAAVEEVVLRPDAPAKVVINERTGTIVMGHHVRISTVAVAHGPLRVKVQPRVEVHQPPPLSAGETVVVETPELEVEEEERAISVLRSGADVEELVAALNAIGATPRDIIAILQAIKAAGALYGELEII